MKLPSKLNFSGMLFLQSDPGLVVDCCSPAAASVPQPAVETFRTVHSQPQAAEIKAAAGCRSPRILRPGIDTGNRVCDPDRHSEALFLVSFRCVIGSSREEAEGVGHGRAELEPQLNRSSRDPVSLTMSSLAGMAVRISLGITGDYQPSLALLPGGELLAGRQEISTSAVKRPAAKWW